MTLIVHTLSCFILEKSLLRRASPSSGEYTATPVCSSFLNTIFFPETSYVQVSVIPIVSFATLMLFIKTPSFGTIVTGIYQLPIFFENLHILYQITFLFSNKIMHFFCSSLKIPNTFHVDSYFWVYHMAASKSIDIMHTAFCLQQMAEYI
jgi:hypothetical protein